MDFFDIWILPGGIFMLVFTIFWVAFFPDIYWENLKFQNSIPWSIAQYVWLFGAMAALIRIT